VRASITRVRLFAIPRGKCRHWDSNFGRNRTNTRSRTPGKAECKGRGRGRRQPDTNTSSGQHSTTSRDGVPALHATSGQRAITIRRDVPGRGASGNVRRTPAKDWRGAPWRVSYVRPLASRARLATAFIENDRAQMSVKDFRLMFILLIGFTKMEETTRSFTTLQLQDSFRTDRSAREIARSNEPMSVSDLVALPGS
jgi:hypothetical protein